MKRMRALDLSDLSSVTTPIKDRIGLQAHSYLTPKTSSFSSESMPRFPSLIGWVPKKCYLIKYLKGIQTHYSYLKLDLWHPWVPLLLIFSNLKLFSLENWEQKKGLWIIQDGSFPKPLQITEEQVLETLGKPYFSRHFSVLLKDCEAQGSNHLVNGGKLSRINRYSVDLIKEINLIKSNQNLPQIYFVPGIELGIKDTKYMRNNKFCLW